MPLPTGKDLMQAYGLDAKYANWFDQLHGQYRDIAIKKHNRLAPCVSHGAAGEIQQLTRLKTLMQFISGRGYGDWAGFLITMNAYSGRLDVELPEGAGYQFWDRLTSSTYITHNRHSDLVCNFVYRHGGLEKLAALEAAAGARGLTITQVLGVIVAARQAGTSADAVFARLLPGNIVSSIRMKSVYPAGVAFPGFARWGKGDHASVDANVRWHFLKHVLSISEVRVEDEHAAEVFPEESAMWWQVLRIRLTLDVFRQHATGHGVGHLEAMFTPANALPPQRVLPYDSVAAFLRAGIGEHPRLIGHLTSTYVDQYRDFGLSESRHLAVARVEVDPKNAYVVGFAGTVFVVGRLDEERNYQEVALSSCYLCLDVGEKMTSSANKELWALDT